MTRRALTLMACALALLALAFAACGDDEGDGNGDEEPTATTEAPATEEPVLDEVRVRLFEWQVDPEVASVPAGSITFDADNIGGADHELVILRTDLAPDALPILEDGSADEAAEGIEVVERFEDIGPGLSKSGAVELSAGSYVLICNFVDETDTGLQSHYAEGMFAAFEVTE